MRARAVTRPCAHRDFEFTESPSGREAGDTFARDDAEPMQLLRILLVGGLAATAACETSPDDPLGHYAYADPVHELRPLFARWEEPWPWVDPWGCTKPTAPEDGPRITDRRRARSPSARCWS